MVAIVVAGALSGADRGRRRPPPRRAAQPDRHDRDPGPVPADPGDGAADQQRRRQRLHLPRADAACRPSRSRRLPIGTPYIAMLILAPAAAGRARLVPAPPPDGHRRSAPPPTTRTPPASRASRRAGWPPWPGRSPAASPPSPRSWSRRRPPAPVIEALGPDLLLKGLAGAVIARMSSIPIAIARLARHRRDRAGPALQPRHPRPGHRRHRADHRRRAAAAARSSAAPARTRAAGAASCCRRCPRPTASVRSIVWLPRVCVADRHRRRGRRSPTSSATTPRRCSPRSPATPWSASASGCSPVSPASSRSGQFAYAGIAAAASVHVVDSHRQLPVRRALRRDRRGAVASALVGIPAMRLQGPRARGLDAGLRAGDLDLAAAPGPLPGRRRRPGEADLVGTTRSTTPSTTTSSRCCCSCIGVWVTNNLRHGGFGRSAAGAARQRGRGARVHRAEPDADAPALRRLRRARRPRRHRDRPRPVAAHRQLVPGRRPASTSSRVTVIGGLDGHARPADRRAAHRRPARPWSGWAWSARPRSPSAGCSS